MIKKVLLCGTLLGLNIPQLSAALVLKGNAQSSTHTFSFNIFEHAFYAPWGRFFVAAREQVNKNEFAVAAASRDTKEFRALTPEKVRLDGILDTNPLFGAAISHLALLGSRPVVFAGDDPSSLYSIDETTSPISVYSLHDIHDAQGEKAKSLLALTTSAPAVITPLESGASLSAFAAIGNSQSRFDGDGSGIALLFFKKFTDKDKKVSFRWDAVNAVTGAGQYDTDGKPTGEGNRAFPIGKDTPAIKIHQAVSSIGNSVDLFFDRDLGRLYIALDVIAGSDATDGARAVVVASSANGKILLQAIAPDAAFQDNTKIVGGRGPLAAITIFKVRTMQTTTYLRYLIVVGGNGTGPSLKHQVYALPLVDNLQDAAHGTLAHVHSEPLTIFNEHKPHRFLARVFNVAAKRAADLYSQDSPGARVGGDGILPGPITDIQVAGDAIFVSVKKEGHDLQPGIFYSQALFDELGRIHRWTEWQRVSGAHDKVVGFSYDLFTGTFWYLPEQIIAPNNESKKEKKERVETNTVLRNEFTQATDSLSLFISHEFPQSLGGVQGLFDFPYTTPSFTTQVGERLAVNVFTGFNKLVFMQSGADQEGFFGPQRTVGRPFISEDGTLKNFTQARTLVLSGGVLEEIGPISSCAVAVGNGLGWFAIGGSGGVAILADQLGQGWQRHPGLKSGFIGLNSSMKFIKVSDAQNVRKLIGVGNNLFVLTDQSVIRLELRANLIAARKVPTVTLAQLDEEQIAFARSYSDLIISGPLALLATSFGLLRSGNHVDIQTAGSHDSVHWTEVQLPESAGSFTAPGPVSRLYALSRTGFETDVVHGGTVWALNAYVGLSEAQIYRFVLSLDQGLVTDKSVHLYPDLFIKNMPTFFANLGDYRNYVITDGALIAVSRSAFNGCKVLQELLAPTLKSGQPNGARSRVPFVNVHENSPSLVAHSMGKLIRDSASGSWMVPGDFGIRIQQ